ncbi:MAG TPA: hypothetical protein VF899_00795 [Pyrinomonadaceae bacterium]
MELHIDFRTYPAVRGLRASFAFNRDRDQSAAQLKDGDNWKMTTPLLLMGAAVVLRITLEEET